VFELPNPSQHQFTRAKIYSVLAVMAATENTTSASKTQTETPWHAAYPAPRNASPSSISRAELLQDFRDGKKVGKEFILVDLRRNDHEVRPELSSTPILCSMLIATKGGTIQGSLNLPAQSLYPSIPTLYAVLSAAKIEVVIWYCGQQTFTLWLEINHKSNLGVIAFRPILVSRQLHC